MRADVLRVYKSLHSWVGVSAGMALFIAFFAGAITVFEAPLARWLTPPHSEPPAFGIDRLDALLPQVFERHPAALERIVVRLSENRQSVLSLTWNEAAATGGDVVTWGAHPGPGEGVATQPAYRSEFADFIDRLHQTAGIPGNIGHESLGVLVMGAVSVLYCLALVSGLIVLLPTLVRDFLAMRRNSSNKRLWLDVHNALGVASLPFHLVIALTAIVFAFHDPIYGLLKAGVYGERPLFERPDLAVVEQQGANNLMPVAALLQRIESRAPEFQVEELEFLNTASPRATLRVAGTRFGEMLRGPQYGYLVLQPYTGAFVYTAMLPGADTGWLGPVTAFFALHFGNYGGNMVRWIYFCLGLAGALVFYSGNLLWIESRRRRIRRDRPQVRQKRSARVLAALTVGACLGTVAGVELALLAARWLWGHVDRIDDWLEGIYYAAFAGSILLSLAAGAARASVVLLRLCGSAALAVPLTTLIALVVPAATPWARLDSSLAVDVTALVAGFGFIWMANRTSRRRMTGLPDSVWSHSGGTVSPGRQTSLIPRHRSTGNLKRCQNGLEEHTE